MPSKNTQRIYDIPAYYHVYNRGVNKQHIFLDALDKAKFLSLLKRHLDPNDAAVRGDGARYDKYDIELVAYCLMGNHFHLLLFQENDPQAITKLLRSVSTAYTMYFNLRYKRQGHLFQGVFKASRINDEAYLQHISRYIHLNPRTYKTYKWSSIGAYLGHWSETWLHPERILDMSPAKYEAFLEDYETKKALLDEIRHELSL